MVEKQRQIVQLLVDKWCDPNGRTAQGMTPLHLAVEVSKCLCNLLFSLCNVLLTSYYNMINVYTYRVGIYTVSRL